MQSAAATKQDPTHVDSVPLSPAWKIAGGRQEPKSALIGDGPAQTAAERGTDKWGPVAERPTPVNNKWRDDERENKPARWTAAPEDGQRIRPEHSPGPWTAGRGRGRAADVEARWGPNPGVVGAAGVGNKDPWGPSGLPGIPAAAAVGDLDTTKVPSGRAGDRWDAPAAGVVSPFTNAAPANERWRAGGPGAAAQDKERRGFAVGRGKNLAGNAPGAPGAPAGGYSRWGHNTGNHDTDNGGWGFGSAISSNFKDSTGGGGGNARRYTVEELRGIAETMLNQADKVPMPEGTNLPDYFTDLQAHEADSIARALASDLVPLARNGDPRFSGSQLLDSSLTIQASSQLSMNPANMDVATPAGSNAHDSLNNADKLGRLFSNATGNASTASSWIPQTGTGEKYVSPIVDRISAVPSYNDPSTTSNSAGMGPGGAGGGMGVMPPHAHAPPGMLGLGPALGAVFSEASHKADKWVYRDPQGMIQGPFSRIDIIDWQRQGYFPEDLPVRSAVEDTPWHALSAVLACWQEYDRRQALLRAQPPFQFAAPATPIDLGAGARMGSGLLAAQPAAGNAASLGVPGAQLHAPDHAFSLPSQLAGLAAPAVNPWGQGPVLASTLGSLAAPQPAFPYGATPATAAAGNAAVADPRLVGGQAVTSAFASASAWAGGYDAAPARDAAPSNATAAAQQKTATAAVQEAVPSDNTIDQDNTTKAPVEPVNIGGWTVEPWDDANGGKDKDAGVWDTPASNAVPASLDSWSAHTAQVLAKEEVKSQQQQAVASTNKKAQTANIKQQNLNMGAADRYGMEPASHAAPSKAESGPAPAGKGKKAAAAAAAAAPAPTPIDHNGEGFTVVHRERKQAAQQAAAPAQHAQQQYEEYEHAAYDEDEQYEEYPAGPTPEQLAAQQASLNRIAPWAQKKAAAPASNGIKTLKQIQEEEAAAAAERAAREAQAAAERAALAETAPVLPGSAWAARAGTTGAAAAPATTTSGVWGAAAAAAEFEDAQDLLTATSGGAAAAAVPSKKAAASAAAVTAPIGGTAPAPRGATLAELFDKKMNVGAPPPPPAWGGASAKPAAAPSLREVIMFEECAADLEGGALDEDLSDLLPPRQVAPPSATKPSKATRNDTAADQDLFWEYQAPQAPAPPPAPKQAQIPAQPGASLAARLGAAIPPPPPPAAKASSVWAGAAAPAKSAATPVWNAAAAARGAVGPAVPPGKAAAAKPVMVSQSATAARATPAAVAAAAAPRDSSGFWDTPAVTAARSVSSESGSVVSNIADQMSPEFWSWARTAWFAFGNADIDVLKWLVTLNCRSEIAELINSALNNKPGAGAFVAEFLKRKDAEQARIANPKKAKKAAAAAASKAQQQTSEWQAAATKPVQPAAKKGAKPAVVGNSSNTKGARANGFALLMK